MGAASPLAFNVYNLSMATATDNCRAVLHEDRSSKASLPLGSFLEHLASDAQQTTLRAYVEDTYLYARDGHNLARDLGSEALHRLEPDLPTTVPAFAGAAHMPRSAR